MVGWRHESSFETLLISLTLCHGDRELIKCKWSHTRSHFNKTSVALCKTEDEPECLWESHRKLKYDFRQWLKRLFVEEKIQNCSISRNLNKYLRRYSKNPNDLSFFQSSKIVRNLNVTSNRTSNLTENYNAQFQGSLTARGQCNMKIMKKNLSEKISKHVNSNRRW